MNKTVTIIVAFVFLALALSVYYTLTSPSTKERYEDPKVRVMLFHAKWCQHCTRYLQQGTFENAANTVPKTVNGVVFETYDYDLNTAKAEAYNVNSFPTIIATDSKDKVYRFAGDRNKEKHLEEFARAVLQGRQLGKNDYSTM